LVKKMVYELMDRIRSEITSGCSEHEIRKAVHLHGGDLVGSLRGRGLSALANQAKHELSNKGLIFSIAFNGMDLVIQIEESPDLHEMENYCGKFAFVFFDEVCKWAGYKVSFEKLGTNGAFVQTFRREDA